MPFSPYARRSLAYFHVPTRRPLSTPLEIQNFGQVQFPYVIWRWPARFSHSRATIPLRPCLLDSRRLLKALRSLKFARQPTGEDTLPIELFGRTLAGAKIHFSRWRCFSISGAIWRITYDTFI
jgi:hypothetical protein